MKGKNKQSKLNEQVNSNFSQHEDSNFISNPEDFLKIIPATIVNNLPKKPNLIRKPIVEKSNGTNIVVEKETEMKNLFIDWPSEEIVNKFSEEQIQNTLDSLNSLEEKYSKYYFLNSDINLKSKNLSNELIRDPNIKFFYFNYSYLYIQIAYQNYFSNKFLDPYNDLIEIPQSVIKYNEEIIWKHPEVCLLNNLILNEIISEYKFNIQQNLISISNDVHKIYETMDQFFTGIKEDYLNKLELYKDYNNNKNVIEIYKKPFNLTVVYFNERKESLTEYEIRMNLVNKLIKEKGLIKETKENKEVKDNKDKTKNTKVKDEINQQHKINYDDDQFSVTSHNLIYLKDPEPQNMNMKTIQIGFFKWITGIFQFIKDNDIPVLFNVIFIYF